MSAKDYIRWIRSKAGHEKIILTFAGGCIFYDRREVLLQRRGDSQKWGFPGGAIEPEETPEMTAVREAKKETGLDVSIGKLISVYTDQHMKQWYIASAVAIVYLAVKRGIGLRMVQIGTEI